MVLYKFNWNEAFFVGVPKVISFALVFSSPLYCAFDVGREVVCCSGSESN